MSIFYMPIAAAFGQNVQPNAGAKLFFFETGTTTPKPTFAEAAETTPNPSPVIADARGRFPAVFLSGLYDVVLQDANDVQIWEAKELFNPSPTAAGITFKGGFDSSTNDGDYPAEGNLGDLYVVTTGFILNPASGSHVLDTGDFIIANTNGATGIDADWNIIKGAQGASLSDVYIRPWDEERAYSINDYAGATDGKIYISKLAQSDNDPAGGGDTVNWKPFGEIVNSLTSTDSTRGLGADQGKILKDVQDTLVSKVISGTETNEGLVFLFKRIILSVGTDADHDIDFFAGNFRFSDGSRMAVLAFITKQINADWASGTDAGGMPATVTKTGTFGTTGLVVTGVGTLFTTEFTAGDILFSSTENEGRRVVLPFTDTLMTLESAFAVDVVSDTVQKNGLAPNGSYHCFALSNADGTTTDAGFDGDVSGANLLADTNVVAAGLINATRQGCRLTDASENILPMFQFNKWSQFIERIMALDTTSNIGSAENFLFLPAPTGVGVRSWLLTRIQYPVDAKVLLVSSPLETDVAPLEAGPYTLFTLTSKMVEHYVITDALARIRYRSSGGAITRYQEQLLGWEDYTLED